MIKMILACLFTVAWWGGVAMLVIGVMFGAAECRQDCATDHQTNITIIAILALGFAGFTVSAYLLGRLLERFGGTPAD